MAENTPALSPREAREQLLPIKIGAEVVGPDGLRGTLVWIGHDRVGISQDGSQKPLYEDKEKIHPIYPGLEPGVGPKRGWVQLLSDHVKITRRGLPRKGHRVRRVSDGIEGTVFWVAGTRLGFKEGTHTTWASSDEVVKIKTTGDTMKYTPWVTDIVPLTWDDVVGHMPIPYCWIRGFNMQDPESIEAVGEDGEFLFKVDPNVAGKLIGTLGGLRVGGVPDAEEAGLHG
jgi:hypothetical protein